MWLQDEKGEPLPAKAKDSSFAHSTESNDARDDDSGGGLDNFPDTDNDKVKADYSAYHHVYDSHSSLDYGYDGDDWDPDDGLDYGSDGDDWDPDDGLDYDYDSDDRHPDDGLD